MDWPIYARSVLALVFVLGLIALAAWLARRFGLMNQMPRARGQKRRLQVLESIGLDNRRRLVLIRRDGVEHLLLLGGANDLVVENAITVSEPKDSLL